MPQITDSDLFEATSLVYSRWAQEFDTLKRVKAETDDGSEDWADFHALRLQNATATEAKWKALLQRLTAACPKLI